MRKKLILTAVVLVLLVAVLLTRCKKKEETTQTQANTESVQPGGTAAVREQKLGIVTETSDGGIQIETEKNGESVTYTFSDVKVDDWYVTAVNFAVTNGLMSGVVDGSGRDLFRPDYGMTRAQLAMILYRFSGGEPVEPVRSYSDVPDYEWYYDCVSWADANGYIEPSDTETFGVNEYCSCEEVLTILHRLAGSPTSTASLEGYPYAPKVDEENLGAVRWAWEQELIAEDECVWYPTQAISRAQIALLFMRYDKLIAPIHS